MSNKIEEALAACGQLITELLVKHRISVIKAPAGFPKGFLIINPRNKSDYLLLTPFGNVAHCEPEKGSVRALHASDCDQETKIKVILRTFRMGD